jgi:hypothetical protein
MTNKIFPFTGPADRLTRPADRPDEPIARSKERMILGAVLLIGLLLRIFICFFTSLPHMHKDSFEYYKQADTLLAGGYTNYFPNGYPFLIALAKMLARSEADTLLLWLNILLSSLMIWFVYDIGKRISSRSAIGLVAAGILAVFPSQINYVRWLMTEVPTAFFLLGAFFFYYRKQFGWSGLFFGVATIVRTNVAPVFILLLILQFIYTKRIQIRLLAGIVLPLLAVGFYCYLRTGTFSVSGNNQINILYSVTASGSYIDFHLGEEHPEINSSGKALHMYVDHLKDNPLQFVQQRLANLWELWGFYASGANGGRGTGSRILLGAGNFFLVVFGLIGWWRNRNHFDISILILPFLVVTLLHTFLFAMPRYTYPVEAFMILLAAWAIGGGRVSVKQ